MGLFSKKKSHSVALFDIDSRTIGAALAHFSEGVSPVLYYSSRVAIKTKEHETKEESMVRTLHEAAEKMSTTGAPLLRKGTGSGHSDEILVSIGSPWQKTSVRSESLNDNKPFVFNKGILAEAMKGGPEVPKGYMTSGQSVVAILLNGYSVPEPYGKKASRADMMIVSSLIKEEIASSVEKTLRKTYHTHALTLTAFAPVAGSVFSTIYQHERDFLVVHIAEESTDIVSIKNTRLTDVLGMEYGIENQNSAVQDTASVWTEKADDLFKEFASRGALPRTIFLISEESSRAHLKKLLDDRGLRSLWLTDEPLRIIPVLSSHFTNFIGQQGVVEIDVFLQLLALYQAQHYTLHEMYK